MRGLYAIVDVSTLTARRIDPLAFARALLKAEPAALQLRAKDLTSRETLCLLRALVPMCRRARVPIVVNDRPDLAALAGCDIVHIGQHDVPVEVVRRLAPNLRIGISTHTLDELTRSLEARPTYVAFGPVFSTDSKVNPDPVVGVDGLKLASERARAAHVPLVAIGGIDTLRTREVAPWASMAALIKGLVPTEPLDSDMSSVTERARVIHQAMGGLTANSPLHAQ